MKPDFAERLRNARLDLRLTQDALAQLWDVGGNYIYMLEARKKPFPEHLQERVIALEREAESKEKYKLSESPAPWGSKELEVPDFNIGLDLILEELTPRQISQLIKLINAHDRLQPQWRAFWIRVLSDWLEIKLAQMKPDARELLKQAGGKPSVSYLKRRGHGETVSSSKTPAEEIAEAVDEAAEPPPGQREPK